MWGEVTAVSAEQMIALHLEIREEWLISTVPGNYKDNNKYSQKLKRKRYLQGQKSIGKKFTKNPKQHNAKRWI